MFLKKIFRYKYGNYVTPALLVFFVIVFAGATFIEEKYDTHTANLLIYHSWWFRIMFVFSALHLLAATFLNKMWSLQKLPNLLVHLSFIIILSGGAASVLWGFDGEMRLLAGEENDTIYIEEPIFTAKLKNRPDSVLKQFDLPLSSLGTSSFSFRFKTKSNDEFTVNMSAYQKYVKQPEPELPEIIELTLIKGFEKEVIRLKEGETFKANNQVSIAFNLPQDSSLLFLKTANQMSIYAPYELICAPSAARKLTVKPGESIPIRNNYVFNTQKGVIVKFNKLHRERKPKHTETYHRLDLDVAYNGQTQRVQIFGGNLHIAEEQEFSFNGTALSFSYGYKPHKLPFKINLERHITEYFPGTKTISYIASDLKIRDEGKIIRKRISHNKVLNYEGYRFFQLNNTDPQVAYLSVNYDRPGTIITYSGYTLLLSGFMLSFVMKNSRIRILYKRINSKKSEKRLSEN